MRIRGLGLGVLSALTAFMLAACSSGPTDMETRGPRVAGSFTELIQQFRDAEKLSALEKDVLERSEKSGRLEAADYEEAYNHLRRCMATRSLTLPVSKLSSGLYEVIPPDSLKGAEIDNWVDEYSKCSEGTIKVIETLYRAQQTNPDLLTDGAQVAVSCLVRSGHLPADYTKEKFQKLVREADDPSRDSIPFDLDDPDVKSCLNGAGFAFSAG